MRHELRPGKLCLLTNDLLMDDPICPRACRDVLEKDTYHFYMGAKGSPHADKKANNIYGAYRGLNLPDDILRKVYETNIDKLFPPDDNG